METQIWCILIAFVAALGLGKIGIPLLRRLKAGQQIRSDGPSAHLSKAGTPTMGGIFIALGMLAALIIFSGKISSYAWFAIIGAAAYGLIGLIDDLIIVLKKRSLGLKPYQKLVMQFVFALLIALYAYKSPEIGSTLYVPFLDIQWDLGIWYIPFTMFVIMALTNSVNLTDGLDGLAGGVTLVNAATFTLIFGGLIGSFVWAEDMAIFAAALTGGILGFLRYNTYPAKVFMGDTGAFFLGGAVVMMAIVSRLQILIPFMGLMYVVSSLSCIIQVGYFKLTKGKRVFKMAPIHHHFELKGMHETKIVVMYMLVTTVTCLLTLIIL